MKKMFNSCDFISIDDKLVKIIISFNIHLPVYQKDISAKHIDSHNQDNIRASSKQSFRLLQKSPLKCIEATTQ